MSTTGMDKNVDTTFLMDIFSRLKPTVWAINVQSVVYFSVMMLNN